jgi:hypothetical protein
VVGVSLAIKCRWVEPVLGCVDQTGGLGAVIAGVLISVGHCWVAEKKREKKKKRVIVTLKKMKTGVFF